MKTARQKINPRKNVSQPPFNGTHVRDCHIVLLLALEPFKITINSYNFKIYLKVNSN